MQRGYTLCTMDLAKVISVDKKNQTFKWIDIASTQSNQPGFYVFMIRPKPGMFKSVLLNNYDGNLPESQVVNVAKLYGKVL